MFHLMYSAGASPTILTTPLTLTDLPENLPLPGHALLQVPRLYLIIRDTETVCTCYLPTFVILIALFH